MSAGPQESYPDSVRAARIWRHTPCIDDVPVPGYARPQESGHRSAPRADRSNIYLDAAQHGPGSRACGPDVWPDFILRPESRSLTFRITAGA